MKSLDSLVQELMEEFIKQNPWIRTFTLSLSPFFFRWDLVSFLFFHFLYLAELILFFFISNDTLEYAIKKFKPDKEGDASASSGISQSACREIALCRELSHENIIFLKEVMLDPWDRSISMIFEYAEHDFLV